MTELTTFLKSTIYKNLEIEEIELRIKAVENAEIERQALCRYVEQKRLKKIEAIKEKKELKNKKKQLKK